MHHTQHISKSLYIFLQSDQLYGSRNDEMLSQSLLVFKCQVVERFFYDFRLLHPIGVEGRIYLFERFS